ncbi:flagellar hook-associated protein FlgL [Mariprofundus sp. KV]|uniref:flagellar hook-associated protein FlgL n=1 Tax=Mariprofundus sp. KV TaxID=2608715 RepID=UPI0015A0404B|nr:flagellar hook-associated protein FlgL [Mariprofundus sp. KV]NWF36559.1 flagellar hook-associated protein 3 [Mariprofundus sp. KV]
MRITSAQLYNNLLAGVQQQMDIQAKGDAKITSGTRYQTPAEAALDYRTSLDIRHAQRGVDGGLEALAIAESRLSVSQNHLMTMNNVFSRAQSLAIQQSSAQVSATERQAAISEITHLTTALLNSANQQWQGQSLFSGAAVDKVAFISNPFNAGTAVYAAGTNTSITNVTQTANPAAVNDAYTITLDAAGTNITSITNGASVNLLAAPVTLAAGANSVTLSNSVQLSVTYSGTPVADPAAGTITVSGAIQDGSVTYNGSSQDRVVNIDPALQVVSNARGDDPAFTAAFQAIVDFKAALLANDTTAISASIASLNSAGNGMIDLTADIGARLDALSITKTTYEEMKAHFAIRLNTHEGVDLAAVVTEMKLSEVSLQATYSQISRLSSLSLINFLR